MAERRITVEVAGGTATVTATTAEPAEKLRHCAICGTLTKGWWCSIECYRLDEGDERYDEDPDDRF